MSHDDRQDTLRSLLKSHSLEPDHFANQLGVQEAVDNFCGSTTNEIFGDKPDTKNSTQPIDNAVNWDSPYW